MNQYKFLEFLEKVRCGQSTESDMEAFRAWVQRLPKKEARKVLNLYEQANNFDTDIEADVIARISKGIESGIGSTVPIQGQRIRWGSVFLKVASVVLLFSTAWFFVDLHKTERDLLSEENPVVSPGSDKAMLLLADGRQIYLDANPSDSLIEFSGATHFKEKKGILEAVATANLSGKMEEHVLSTPKGGQYKLVLSDGTKVWLNASSTIRFPSNFNTDKREVQVSGEVYFEVAKMVQKPFIVHAPKMDVEVLGTQFNIASYQEDANYTTLVEGKVKLSSKGHEIVLKPGDEARISDDGKPSVKQVETLYATAWKDGYFMFNYERIEQVMDKIARWYDVEIVYVDGIPDKRFWGSISKYDQVSNVFKMLEETGGIKLDLVGRRVMVKKL
ncbi:FecR family protein [Olivibacter sitiensis]|uniref:FecR family protein n=1 Tax=Olivibacter sitiensis TaxID=376470 RepID=UPI0003F9AF7D|nr:FecR domain-containing protein [Olivibacter sitiensis]